MTINLEPTHEYLEKLDKPEVLQALHNISIADNHLRFLPYCQTSPNFLGRVVKMIPIDKKGNEILQERTLNIMERALINKLNDKEYKDIELPYDELNKKVEDILKMPIFNPGALAVQGMMMSLGVWKNI